MGGYCRYCGRRCFLLRVTRDGRTLLLATCERGMAWDLRVCGQTHETAVNPILQPRAAARLGLARVEAACGLHCERDCPEVECREVRERLLEASRTATVPSWARK